MNSFQNLRCYSGREVCDNLSHSLVILKSFKFKLVSCQTKTLPAAVKALIMLHFCNTKQDFRDQVFCLLKLFYHIKIPGVIFSFLILCGIYCLKKNKLGTLSTHNPLPLFCLTFVHVIYFNTKLYRDLTKIHTGY